MGCAISKRVKASGGPFMTDDEIRKAGFENTKHILQPYFSGEPYFTRAMLEEIDTILTECKTQAKGTSVEGLSKFLNAEENVPDGSWEYRISYTNVQKVIDIGIDGTNCVIDMRPLSIWRYKPEMERLSRSHTDAEALYQSSRKAWLASQTFLLLKAHLDTITFPISINKIVCFGLGTPASPYENVRHRSNIQHAAVESLMENLNERNGTHIRCYAQDPDYDESDKELLKAIGVEVIEDPKGFLEVDGNTLVVTVAPNIAVRQIVADLQWPAAMLWNTVGSMDIEMETWDKVLSGNDVEKIGDRWQSVWTTDPDSPGLRLMVENCVQHKLQDDCNAFRDVTLYIRKPTIEPVSSSTQPNAHM